MGSKYMATYICDKNVINDVVGSGDRNYADQLTLNDEQLPYIEKLLNRDYSRDPETHESPDAHNLIYAFEVICKKECSDYTAFEVYIDMDESPELWKFQVAGWSEPDELKLPLSEHGVPMVNYIDATALEEHGQILAMLANSGKNNDLYISDEDLDTLVNVY